MGREIKFKIWLPGIKKMSYEHTLEELMNWGTKEWTNGTAIFLQYTGLKDRNGREIYEGDLLKDDAGIGEVEWVQEHCAFMIFTREPSFYYHLESDGELKVSEVVGNIFENPELIEV